MTAESIQHPSNVSPDLSNSLGGLSLLGATSERVALVPDQITDHADLEPLSPNTSARAVALAATIVKEKFQALPAYLRADERDTLRAQLREDSVRLLFKAFDLIQDADDVDLVFSAAYRKAEAIVLDVDRQKLIELADKYDDNPAIKVFTTLKNISSVKDDDIVFMRRTSLALLDSNELQ